MGFRSVSVLQMARCPGPRPKARGQGPGPEARARGPDPGSGAWGPGPGAWPRAPAPGPKLQGIGPRAPRLWAPGLARLLTPPLAPGPGAWPLAPGPEPRAPGLAPWACPPALGRGPRAPSPRALRPWGPGGPRAKAPGPRPRARDRPNGAPLEPDPRFSRLEAQVASPPDPPGRRGGTGYRGVGWGACNQQQGPGTFHRKHSSIHFEFENCGSSLFAGGRMRNSVGSLLRHPFRPWHLQEARCHTHMIVIINSPTGRGHIVHVFPLPQKFYSTDEHL